MNGLGGDNLRQRIADLTNRPRAGVDDVLDTLCQVVRETVAAGGRLTYPGGVNVQGVIVPARKGKAFGKDCKIGAHVRVCASPTEAMKEWARGLRRNGQ